MLFQARKNSRFPWFGRSWKERGVCGWRGARSLPDAEPLAGQADDANFGGRAEASGIMQPGIGCANARNLVCCYGRDCLRFAARFQLGIEFFRFDQWDNRNEERRGRRQSNIASPWEDQAEQTGYRMTRTWTLSSNFDHWRSVVRTGTSSARPSARQQRSPSDNPSGRVKGRRPAAPVRRPFRPRFRRSAPGSVSSSRGPRTCGRD